ncbi:serine hydrolase domain-containing protein [Oceanirhabdus seepicola]|uniref:Beta-lactamase family protein n=1 Tax=Oceanirhabdus seepicola TaxID=2828781 RepID=A0A9J6NVK5_9CLOT|nr:serine hydrolase domain-containing protein [Oceanirhabdus seepicola]MCM1988519.1 beta-lactamase family protein [Oceanirhabdus seepicola]
MDRKENIKRIIEDFVSKQEFSGTILVKEGEEIIYREAHGYAHRGFKVKNKIDTKFDTASVTKLFTAVAILQLIEKGILSFDDKVLAILDIKNSKLNKKINIFHLLTHSAGMADDADEVAGENYEDLFIDKPNYSIRELKDFLPNFIYKEQNFEPGEGVRYNNCAFILLGLVLEKLTGKKYRDYVTENVFKRVGMDNTGFFSMDGIAENVAEGYVRVRDKKGNIGGFRKNIYSYPPIGSPDGGVLSTVDDLAKFYESLLEGELLGEQMTMEMITPKINSGKYSKRKVMNGYVFEFTMNKESDKIYYFIKEGINAGVVANSMYIPEYDVKIMTLGNQYANVWKLGKDIVRAYFEELRGISL